MIEIDQCTVTLSEVRKDLVMKETRTEIMCVSFKKKKTLVTAGLPGICLRYFVVLLVSINLKLAD